MVLGRLTGLALTGSDPHAEKYALGWQQRAGRKSGAAPS